MRFLLVLACVGSLAACDSAEPLSADGRWVGSRDLGFDVPFTGRACDQDYTDARRLTSGRIRQFDLTLTEEAGRLSGESTLEFDFRNVIRQPGLPECPEGGNSVAESNFVTGSRQNDHITVAGFVFVERAEFDISPTSLSGFIRFEQGPAEAFGGLPDVPITLRRVSGLPR